MIPTPTNCYSLIRSEIGDTAVSGGQVYVDAILLPFFTSALEPLLKRLNIGESEYVRQDLFYYLNAYSTGIPENLIPANLSTIERVWERGNVVKTGDLFSVVYTSTARNVTITTIDPHGLTLPGLVQGTGSAVDGLSTEWAATNPVVPASPTSILLNDAYLPALTTGPIVGSNLVIMQSPDQWTVVTKKIGTEEFPTTLDGLSFDIWTLKNGKLRLPPVNHARELKLECKLGKTITAASDSLVVDGSLNYFVYKVSALAIAGKVKSEKVTILENKAEKELFYLRKEAGKRNQKNRYSFKPYSPIERS